MRDERDRAALPGFFVGQRGSGFAAARKLVFRLPWHVNNGNRQPENPISPFRAAPHAAFLRFNKISALFCNAISNRSPFRVLSALLKTT